ncbi:nucleotidyltransferase domain-containing protein [Candidatus Woesearchaeota archaeon]|nr:nucleotidyltransferase domain-containing protein [Candidatus Woesearchaeota archaeon]
MVHLIELLGNRSIVKLLDFFISNPKKEFSQVKIKNKTKLSKATLTKWLCKLEKDEFIKVKKEGVSKLYKLDNDNLIIKHIKIINNITKLKEVVRLSKKHNIKIWLYGSVARGEDTEESDIDLLLIGNIKKEDIITDINKLSDKINKKIQIKIFTPLEWYVLSKKDKAFYERVEKDKIEL